MNERIIENLNLASAAFSELRGGLPSALSRRYLLCLIFLKFLGDMREARLQDNRSRSKSGLPSVDFLGLAQGAEPGKDLDQLFVALEQHEALTGIFSGLNFERDLSTQPGGKRRLTLALQLISRLDLRAKPPDTRVPEDTFERMLENFAAAEGKGGNFETPQEVADLMASIADPKPGSSVYDPFCRSGSILVSLFKRQRGALKICGQESTQELWSTCRLNLSMHGAFNVDIRCSDALNFPFVDKSGALQRFDVVASNPPFGRPNRYAEDWGRDAYKRFRLGTPPKQRAEYAFILHMIESAKEGSGKVVTLLPMGALFRGGSESHIRERIVEENLLDCVVALPANLFHGTAIPVALLLLRKDKSDQVVTFIDASRGFLTGRSRNRLAPGHADAILKALRSKRPRKGYSHKAALKEIRANGYNLSVALYVEPEKGEGVLSAEALRREISMLDHELSGVRRKLDSLLKALG